MNDWGDWADESYTAPRTRWSRLVVLVLVLAAVAAVGFVAYAALDVGSKVARFAGSFVEETTHSKSSPDSRWALVIHTFDEGALGGSTTVYLKPTGAGAGKTTLYDDDWLPDSAVRWLDARIVSINGVLQMPFVEHSIPTGSPRTTGTATDASGYVHDEIVCGERVVMLSGLSLVLPDGLSGQILTRRSAAPGLPWQRLVLAAPASWSVTSLRTLRETQAGRLARTGRLIGRSRNGRVEARWDPATHSAAVVTRLPGRLHGLVRQRGVSADSPLAARRSVERLWRLLSIEGAKLPW